MVVYTSTGIAFSCGRGADVNDTSLCVNPDATCNRNHLAVQGEFCECPPGYIHDYTGTRSPNCALPTWFLPAFFAFTTVGTVWALALLLPEVLWRLRSAVRRAVTAYCVAVVFVWAHVASVYLQQGNFVPGIIFMTIFMEALLVFAYFAFHVVVDPICATIGQDWRKVRRKRFMAFFPLAGVALFIIQVSLLVYSDPSTKESRDTFNLIYVFQVVVAAACWPLNGSAIGLQTRQLIAIIEELGAPGKCPSADGKSKYEAFLKQLRYLRNLAHLMSLNCITLIIGAAIELSLGSVPYQFLFWAANMLTWPAAYMVKRSVRQKQQKEKVSDSGSIVADAQVNVPSAPKSGES